jgi:hypothetical protein
MAAGPMRLVRFARRVVRCRQGADVDRFAGPRLPHERRYRRGLRHGRRRYGRAALVGGVREEILGAERTVLRSLLRGCKRLRDCSEAISQGSPAHALASRCLAMPRDASRCVAAVATGETPMTILARIARRRRMPFHNCRGQQAARRRASSIETADFVTFFDHWPERVSAPRKRGSEHRKAGS